MKEEDLDRKRLLSGHFSPRKRGRRGAKIEDGTRQEDNGRMVTNKRDRRDNGSSIGPPSRRASRCFLGETIVSRLRVRREEDRRRRR